jgi:hypothetical protein
MISFDIQDAGKLTRYVGERLDLAKRRGAVAAGQRLVQVITSEIIPREDPPPIDQRAYVAGWDSQPTRDGADVFNTAPHAAVIETGARASAIKPGRAMVNALAEWAVRKGLLGTGKGSIQGRSQEAEAQSMAWAIIQNMRKKGIFNRGSEGLHIAAKAAKRAPAILAEEIRAEIEQLMKGGT